MRKNVELNTNQINENIDNSTQSLSQWKMIWRAFIRHRLAVGASIILIIFYLAALLAGFISPNDPAKRYPEYIFAPPQIPHFVDQEGNFHIRPFVYGLEQKMDSDTWQRTYEIDSNKKNPIYFFVRAGSYKLMGVFETDIHLFRTKGDKQLFLFGTDELGRDLFSRIIYGSRISLSIGLIGVFISLIVGLIIGGISGLFGGFIDIIIQRVIEILISIPKIPLWMALSAALPSSWSSIKVYFAITILLSLVGWVNVARVVRGKFLSLRDEDFVLAARVMGANDWWLISRHLIPNFLSYVLVSITLSIPGMILGETSLSFLGIGLRPPIVSWGVLLQQAQNMRTVSMHPWLLLPGLFVIIAVLTFNFVGDGLRDAADPYSD